MVNNFHPKIETGKNIKFKKVGCLVSILLISLQFSFILSSCTTTISEQSRNEIQVKNLEELNAAISSARPGDHIIMANGTWNDATINFKASARASAPITLKAQTAGKVILSGDSRITFSKPHLIVDGISFTNGTPSSGNVIEFKSDSCRLTNSAIVDFNPEDFEEDYYWVFFEGNHNRVDHSYFSGKSNEQPLVGNNQDNARHNSVDHCYFKDIPYRSENGREIFRIWGYGRSEELGDDGAYFTIEYNLFENAHGEGTEIISFKSNRNIARYNTIRATKGGIVGRSGNYNTIEGNFILGENIEGTNGIRVAGQGHRVVNNYIADIDGDGLILISGEYIEKDLTGNYEPIEREGTPLGRVPMYGHVRNGLFAHNTFVNTGGIDIHIGASYKANWNQSQRVLIPENNIITNNLIYKTKGGKAIAIPQQDKSAPLDILSFQENIFKGNIVSGAEIDLPTNPFGILVVDNPGLSLQDGLYKLKEDSPAIDHAAALEEPVKEDFEGQPRLDPADVGADEYSSAEITHRPLTPQDVGPERMK